MSSQDIPMKAGAGYNTKHLPDGGTGLDENELKKVFIGSIDAGTTSSRFIIFDGTGQPVAQHQIEFSQKYPQSGYAFFLCLRITHSVYSVGHG
jgi:hypothetical protein